MTILKTVVPLFKLHLTGLHDYDKRQVLLADGQGVSAGDPVEQIRRVLEDNRDNFAYFSIKTYLVLEYPQHMLLWRMLWVLIRIASVRRPTTYFFMEN